MTAAIRTQEDPHPNFAHGYCLACLAGGGVWRQQDIGAVPRCTIGRLTLCSTQSDGPATCLFAECSHRQTYQPSGELTHNFSSCDESVGDVVSVDYAHDL
jgi:hypothetical protein